MEEWKVKAKELKFDLGLTWSELDEAMTVYFPGFDKTKIRETVRGYLRNCDEYYKDKPKQNIVGVFSDAHIPFDHPNYLQFLKDTFKKHKVAQIVCCGDLVDNHALSRHQTEPIAKSAEDELNLTIDRVKAYTTAFKTVSMCEGNHDSIPYRQAATLGLSKRFMRSYAELLELPKTWDIQEQHIIDNVLYKHGINCGGKDGVLNTAILERMSTVIGHSHSFGGVKYSANPRDIIFGLNVGCGIDISAYAFAYGKHSKYRPTLGCGIVYSDSYAEFIPMGKEYFRD